MSSKTIITDKVPICHGDQKIQEIKKYLFEHMQEFVTIEYLYVLDEQWKLQGVLSIHELFKYPESAAVREYCIKEVVKVFQHTKSEAIAHLALQHKIKSVPVVDKTNRFIGVVSSDVILEILNTENHEDFMQIEGILPVYTQQDSSIMTHFLLRTPWIIIGIFGGLFAAKIIGSFEHILEKELMLAFFIPLVVYLANAVGSQTQTLYIRALATTPNLRIWSYSIKQLWISLLISVACWLVISVISLLLFEGSLVGLIVGLAVVCSILMATIFALLVPFLLTKYHKDPAIGSGPFTTIIQDVLSVLIYFGIATLIL